MQNNMPVAVKCLRAGVKTVELLEVGIPSKTNQFTFKNTFDLLHNNYNVFMVQVHFRTS